jgi:predicted nucleic acid-binding protein
VKLACDTSVLVPALATWHVAHEECAEAMGRIAAVPAHVLIETFSVLTRLPEGQRVSVQDAAAVLTGQPWATLHLPIEQYPLFFESLATANVGGGRSYDALILVTANSNGYRLLTRDRRAMSNYEALGGESEVMRAAAN